MSTISGYDSNSISTLFSGFGTSSSSSLDFATYSSIKSGAYKKLLTSYYNKQSANNESSSTSSTTATQSVAAKKVNATSVRDEASALVDASTSLKSVSLWDKKSVTDEDGKTTKEYNTDAIYKAVSSFVDKYNSLVTGTGSSSDDNVLRSASNMVGYTKANKDLLSKVGIAIGSDNKLKIDEEAFKDSNMSTVKSVFTGSGSYGQSTSASASSIYSSAVSQLSKIATSSTYGNDGSYNFISGSTFSQYL